MINRTAAYGMYSPHVALSEIVNSLNREGFENQDICMVLSPEHPTAALVKQAKIVDARNESDANMRTIGWVSELGAVVIPTVGFFIRSQDFFRALLTEQDYPSLSRDCRTLAGLGFSEVDARRLGGELAEIGVLIYVSCGEKSRADCAIDLLRRTGAHEAASVSSKTFQATA